MKNLKKLKRIFVFAFMALAAVACHDKVRYEYLMNVPIYTDYESFKSTGGFEGPKSMETQGAIYYKDQHIFMVEPDKGIHFVNIEDPTSPNQTGFLNVWGATSMAIRGDYLYVNSFIDLLVYNVADFTNPVFVDRLEDVFPTALPHSEGNYPYEPIDKTKGVVTAWEVKEMESDAGEELPTFENPGNWGIVTTFEDNSFGGGEVGTGSNGVAGSISLFTIINDYLYVIEEGQFLHPFDITNPASPNKYDQVGVWGDVETLFPYESYLFMGTPSGMIIYDTENPTIPAYVSSLSHARGCDPVVVQDDFAYVTVRSGGPCGGNINQLDVIDVSNMSSPELKRSFEMDNPHGLGIDGDQLFICDGDAGLKVFDASTPEHSGDQLLHQFKNIQATDIIPLDGIALVVGQEGIYLYSYLDPSNIYELSKINF